MSDKILFDVQRGLNTVHGLNPDQIEALRDGFQALFGVNPAMLDQHRIRQRVAARVAFSNELYAALQELLGAYEALSHDDPAWDDPALLRAHKALGIK